MLTDIEEKALQAAIGKRIKQAMKTRGMTQAELAAKVLPLGTNGTPQQNTISKWINGTRSPTTIQWCTLAHVLNVSLDWLLLGKEKTNIQDIARSLSELANITDMHIEQCTQERDEIEGMDKDEQPYNGIQITLFPLRESFYPSDLNPNIISRFNILLERKILPLGNDITVSDNRGIYILNFLRNFAVDLKTYKDNTYTRFNYDLNNRVNLLISALPALPTCPIPDNLNKNELYKYPFTPTESKEIPWFIDGA